VFASCLVAAISLSGYDQISPQQSTYDVLIRSAKLKLCAP
jgi:hypothetical protein